MKAIHVLHAGVTFVLFIALVAVGVLLLVGVLKFQFPGEANINGADRSKGRLIVVRGSKPNMEYHIYEGKNIIGRADQQPVDIDLFAQEAADRVWSSRQHALITWENGTLFVEDLNSTNGTFVNRNRVPPGEKKVLHANDIIQIGEVKMRIAK